MPQPTPCNFIRSVLKTRIVTPNSYTFTPFSVWLYVAAIHKTCMYDWMTSGVKPIRVFVAFRLKLRHYPQPFLVRHYLAIVGLRRGVAFPYQMRQARKHDISIQTRTSIN